MIRRLWYCLTDLVVCVAAVLLWAACFASMANGIPLVAYWVADAPEVPVWPQRLAYAAACVGAAMRWAMLWADRRGQLR
ncbi:hypothetical protein LCGC14_0983390 [marine sediment metagenome]|uniref:RDD domain-containing protein n=1 Tax=marine sediment metagenome TaxID=412755 RepID=A0A0F9N7X5_9ZZZZ